MSTPKTLGNVCDVLVVGSGAAGMMAAVSAARAGASVLLVERMEHGGRKLRITGKGRCNLTNDCTLEELLPNVPTNPRFLYAALRRFSPADTMAFFEAEGVPLKTERGRRVFPVSDRAEDIVDALVGACRQSGVRTVRGRVTSLISANGSVCGVKTEDGASFASRAVILATGGRSYPRTGSTGDGYALCASVGHTVTPILPSLVPIVSHDRTCARLQGLSLRNVSLTVKGQNGKAVYTDFGEMMFTHFGLTGPMVLSASAHIPDIAPGRYRAVIDLKPALDEKQLDARILSDFSQARNKDFINALDALLPQKLIPIIVERSGIPERQKVNAVTKEQRAALLRAIKCFEIPLDGFRPIDEAIVTKGGVNVKEITPSTMASKLCRGLYVAGELLDVDAYTGGYNLQIAFATGVLAGESAAYETQIKEGIQI
ncbi:MAG: NAD(P)/FAD-dependent oxidoreductase [Ruminococcaceae bacterium]|nr:NAD(P)/FAD-dependent oxidoreductase [Oscillospiraceae bacterium]